MRLQPRVGREALLGLDSSDSRRRSGGTLDAATCSTLPSRTVVSNARTVSSTGTVPSSLCA